jgi:hypothetical protein
MLDAGCWMLDARKNVWHALLNCKLKSLIRVQMGMARHTPTYNGSPSI